MVVVVGCLNKSEWLKVSKLKVGEDLWRRRKGQAVLGVVCDIPSWHRP